MKAELKTKWIEALRSGRYRQAQNVLRDPSGAMCCLGVLLDVDQPTGWGAERINRFHRHCVEHVNSSDSDAQDFLGLKYRESQGLEFSVIRNGDPAKALHVLTEMNDSGRSFSDIADWIEENVPAEA